MGLSLRYAVRSDLGLVRGNNEDAVYAGPRLLAIADGMGGHAAGEVASKIVIGALESLDDDRSLGDAIAALRAAVLEANQRITDAVEQDPNLAGMGTTLTALRFSGSQVALVHVGDSRAYLLRGNTLSQITHDDTYVQYLVDSGKLTPDEAKDHPRKSVILRALRGAEVEPDVSIREARAGDRYLLCTDGLTDVVSTDTIFDTLHMPDAQDCADRLVELALRGGGPDNVTVIVADVVNARPGDPVDDVPVMAGAFVDPAAADIPGDSAAERAANLQPRPPAETARPPEASRRIPWKVPVIVAAVLLVIGGALGGVYAWAQTQYYVGSAGGRVAIYRGVDASFGPLRFSEISRNTGVRLRDLLPSWRSQVQSGIPAKSRQDAQSIVRRLRHELKPFCSTISATPTPTPTPTPTRTRTTTPSPSPSPTRSPASRRATSSAAGTTGSASAHRGSSHRPAPVTRAAATHAAATHAAATHAAATHAGATRAAARPTRAAASATTSGRVRRTPTPSSTPTPTPAATSATPVPTPSLPALGTQDCRGPR